jgi:membrane-anchored mycosin MYCP
MRAAQLGGLAVAGALGLAALTATAPAAAKPSPTPQRSGTKPSPGGSATPTPTPTPTPTITCAPAQPVGALQTQPWAQQRLDYQRVWSLTRGAGVTVAVVDSGVDANHPQLTGHVRSVDITHTLTRDCIGHGTAVAGIIVAQDQRGRDRPLMGIAPEVNLVSVKFTNQDHTDGSDPNLAKGIREAVAQHAKVINVSVTAPDTPDLRSAVKFAQEHDAVVVAAVGNVTDRDRGTTGPAYPAQYPDVISAASLDPTGKVAQSSNTSGKVTVGAPGTQIATTWPGGYAPAEEGTSFAAAFVSGTVALIRAYHPELNYKQVESRIEATADGSVGLGSGAGMINPLEAVTALLPGEGGDSGGGTQPGAGRPVRVAARPEPDRHTRDIALVVTGVTLGVGALAAAGGVFIPMGRRRGWQPGRPTLPADAETKDT